MKHMCVAATSVAIASASTSTSVRASASTRASTAAIVWLRRIVFPMIGHYRLSLHMPWAPPEPVPLHSVLLRQCLVMMVVVVVVLLLDPLH